MLEVMDSFYAASSKIDWETGFPDRKGRRVIMDEADVTLHYLLACIEAMDKKRKNENDEISQLLDSFQADQEDTLEQKMDRFTKTQNRSRVKKHKPEPEIPFQSKKEEPSLGDTFVVGSKDLNEPKEDLSATRTVMWNADELKQEADATNKTVVIDDDEIQSLLEEGKGPQL